MLSLDDRKLMVKIARLYYESDLTQSEIGRRLGISRQKVQRYLKRARETEVVRIWIEPLLGIYDDEEVKLLEKFGLREAVVVETTDYSDQGTIAREIGSAAAEYVLRVIQPGDKIVISNMSRAVLAMALALQARPPRNLRGVVVIQGLSEMGFPSVPFDQTDLTSRLARALGGQALFIPAPGIAADEFSYEAFCADAAVANVLALARGANMAIMGIGAVGPQPTPLWENDVISPDELAGLISQGVVGEINLHYFDAEGRQVPSSLDHRVVGLTLEEIRDIPLTVGVAGGERKFHAVLGALRGNWLDVLITDHITASRLLEA